MNQQTNYRFCPKCKTRRGVGELVCQGPAGADPCGWDLTGEDILSTDDPVHRPPAPPNRPLERFCPNGHRVHDGDLLCGECDTEITPEQRAAEVEIIPGWVAVDGSRPSGIASHQFKARRIVDGRIALVTIYAEGSQPDGAVYETLRSRVPREHIPELLSFGNHGGQAYDVSELIEGGSLADMQVSPSDTQVIRSIVKEVANALAAFTEVGLRHRALHPGKVLVRSLTPLDLVITGFESGRLSDADLETASLLDVSRYSAPEAVMGAVASASDWWGLGMMLLGIATGNRCFEGANDQLFLIHVQANGAPIPQGLEPRVSTLLQGLLASDRTKRWQWREVAEWLEGGSPPLPPARASEAPDGPAIRLGGRELRNPRKFAIEAARVDNWKEACDLLSRGRIGQWAEELKLAAKDVSGLRQLGRRTEIPVGFRLGVALQLLDPQLPLIYEEAIVTPGWLLANYRLGHELITGPIPSMLESFGIESDGWLMRLCTRAKAVEEMAGTLEIELDRDRLQVLVLSEHSPLAMQWEHRRRDLPDANRAGLATVIERRNHRAEDLIVLLAAEIGQYRSSGEILAGTEELAANHRLPRPSDEQARGWLAMSRRELYATVDERISGFARCSHARLDAWADQFRLERRLPLREVLLLLTYPAEAWDKPRHQEYVSSVLGFFEKRVSAATQRGQLVKMRLGKTTPRLDFTELAENTGSATTLLTNLIQRSEKVYQLGARVFAEPEGPGRRARTLLSRGTQYLRDTGINGTYIGFPFLSRRAAGGQAKALLAPVLLWPVKLSGEIGTQGRFSIAFDPERGDVRLNPAFEGLFGLEGARAWREIGDDLMSRSSAGLADVIDAFATQAEPTGQTLRSLPAPDAPGRSADNQLLCCAVLFHLAFVGQALVEDLRQIKQRPLDGTALEAMLRLGEELNGTEQRTPQPPDTTDLLCPSERFVVTDVDPSQEEAIAKARKAPGLLVQGPPGTGKSQTIVNLVADAIGHGKSVLIVCQKLPALEVVRKRLVAGNLGERIVLITNVTSDRMALLREVRDQLENLGEGDAERARHREREAVILEDRIGRLETDIDARHESTYRLDPVSGYSYRQILGELIGLEGAGRGTSEDVLGLRMLLGELPAATVAECEDTCGSLADDWVAASFEGNPLEVTKAFPHDEAYLAEFRRVLGEFIAAEEVRESIPKPLDPDATEQCPEGLENWLGDHRIYLSGLTDDRLRAYVPLIRSFSKGGQGDRYAAVLERLLELELVGSTRAVVPDGMLEWIGPFDDAQVASISSTCERHAARWLASSFEGSPLAALRTSADEPGSGDAFRIQLEKFEAAEKVRQGLIAGGKGGGLLSDPEPLENWLRASERPFEQAFDVAGESSTLLLRLEDETGLCRQYEAVLRAWLDHLASVPLGEAVSPRMEALLARCDERRSGRIVDECGRLADAWLRDPPDELLMESLADFPPDSAGWERLRVAIKRYVDAVKRRDELAVLGPTSADPGDPEVLRGWLAEGERVLTSVDPAAFEDVARWVRLFHRSEAGGSPAQEIHKRLEALCATTATLSADPDDRALADAVAALENHQLDGLSQLAGPRVPGFGLARMRARCRLWWWLRASRLPRRSDAATRADLAFRRERERRRARSEVEDAVRALGIAIGRSSWEGLEGQVRGVINRLTSAYVVCRVIAKSPGKADKSALLKGGDRDAVLRHVREMRTRLDVHDAERAVRESFESLRSFMSAEWLKAQAEAIASSPMDPGRRDQLDGLLAKLPQLMTSASLCSQLTRCDPLTPKLLSSLGRVRSYLEFLPNDHLSGRVQSIIRLAATSAQKRRLEESSPVLQSLPTARPEDAATVCDKLAAVAKLKLLLDTCPTPSSLRAALKTGSPGAVRDVLETFRAGVSMARARRTSEVALAGLAEFTEQGWRAECGDSIAANTSNEGRLRSLQAAMPGISAYMAFRRLAIRLEPSVVRAFALLAAERRAIEAIPEEVRSTEVGRSIRVAYARSRQALLETEEPALRSLLASNPVTHRKALDALHASKKLARVLRDCPLAALLVPALRARDVRGMERVLQDFEGRVARARCELQSLETLVPLRDWMKDQWITEAERKIRAGGSNSGVLHGLSGAMPTLRAFQVFRTQSVRLSPLHFKIFRALARVRSSLVVMRSDSVVSLTEAVRRTIRREALLAWKARLEARYPELLVTDHAVAAKVASLAQLDEELRALNRERLGADLPLADIKSPDEWEDITRLSGPRAIRIREFFRQGRERGLLTLRPVWMMTPEVASQLLPLEKSLFDVVILDEASQMPVEFAVPSLYRARTVVVSGDDKQMPPSSFFSSRINSDEPDWSEDEPLDDCASEQERTLQEQTWNRRELKDCPDVLSLGLTVLPKTTLQIHYRSEFRELIGYSNAAFYRNELGVPVRHPDDAVREHRPIEYLAVNGTYGNQQNPDEARKVVEVLADLWRRTGVDRPSVGIVTFNVKQAELIDELLQEQADTDPKFRETFAEELDRKDRGEDMSLFVKNVENVQGDERDFIIFSTTFGRNSAGLFRRNFGALGQAGGERRLNVAVTRARRKVIVVGSMPIEEISDLLGTRRQPEDPRDYLQAYLQYAKLLSDGHLEEARRLSERLSTRRQAVVSKEVSRDAFKKSVADFVRELGHEPIPTADDPILGVDFSIRDPRTRKFGVGIECDPPDHRLTRRARAREIWRPAMLLRAYPVIHKVSISAWYDGRQKERDRLGRCIAEAIHTNFGGRA